MDKKLSQLNNAINALGEKINTLKQENHLLNQKLLQSETEIQRLKKEYENSINTLEARNQNLGDTLVRCVNEVHALARNLPVINNKDKS